MSFAMTEAPIAKATAAHAASAITRPFGTPLPLNVCLASISVSSCRLVGLVDRRHELQTSPSTPTQAPLNDASTWKIEELHLLRRSYRATWSFSRRSTFSLPWYCCTGE